MEDPEIFYCLECAEKKLSQWKGWPHRSPPVPYLHPLEDDNCRTCGSENRLSNRKIFWFNVHEKYNTGLPNYWILKIDADPWYGKWGRPYIGKMLCSKCKNPATISVFGPNQNYIKYNCEACDKVLPQRRA